MRWPRWLLWTMAAAVAAVVADPVVGPFFAPQSRRRGLSSEKRSSRFHSTIVKGKYATSRKFPYQVYLRVFLANGTVDFCGGAIIGNRHVLSAAHCVDKPNVTKEMAVVGSEHRFGAKALRFNIVRQTFYRKSHNERVDADIVILTVDRPIPVGRAKVDFVKIQTNRQFDRDVMCTVAGWGDSLDDRDPNLLKHVVVPLVSDDQCRKSYPLDPPEDLLCAGYYETGGADTCQGDSGGPLVCGGKLTGLVKGGVGCGLPRYPGTYTDISYYWNWVKKTMADDLRKEYLGKAKKRTACMHGRKSKQLPCTLSQKRNGRTRVY